MLIKLPVCIDDKIVFQNFLVNRTDDIIKIKVFKRDYSETVEKVKISCCNNYEGISYLDLYFPLELKIINNKIIFVNFMQKLYYSQNNLPVDFFSLLEKRLEEEYKVSFMNFSDFVKNETKIWMYFSSLDLDIEVNDNLLRNLWINSQLYLNYSLFLLSQQTDYSSKNIELYRKKYNIPKKLISVVNGILTIKYSIQSSNNYTFIEHKNRVLNRKMKQDNNINIVELNDLKIGFSYFIKSHDNNKFIQIKIQNIQDNIIYCDNNCAFLFSNYIWDYYIPLFELKEDQVYFYLLNSKEIYNEIFSRNNLKIESIHTQKILEYYNNSNNECSLIYLRKFFEEKYSDIEILRRNNYSESFFNYIIKQYTKKEDVINILKILFTNYSYPIKFNKLDRNFDNIIAYSIANINTLFVKDTYNFTPEVNSIIPGKLKILYYNLIRMFYQIMNNSYEYLIFNNKFYNDYLHRIVLKNILFVSKSQSYIILKEKLNMNQFTKIVDIIKNTMLCLDVVVRLTWANLPKRLYYLTIMYENKDILFYIDKLNKNIFPDNYDLRLRKLIENPFEMFKYLRKEKDFIRWVKFLGTKTMELFYTPISISSDDLMHLGKIIYLMLNVKEQNIKDESYLKFIVYTQKYGKFVLDNMRINLKVREYFGFIKYNLNLGYLAKHLTYNKDGIIDLDDDVEKNNEIVYLESKLKEITKKYYKYKIKYFKTKNPNMGEYIISETSNK